MRLLSLAILSQQPADPQALASVRYRARLGLRDGQDNLSTEAVEQTVRLERVRDQWLIIGGDDAQITSAPAQATAPLARATIPTDSAPAIGSAVEMLSRSLAVAPMEIHLVSSEALTWSNACLGVTQLGVTCEPGDTPGFRIILEWSGQRYEYHTDANGLRVRPGKEGPVIAGSVAGSAAREKLANSLGIPADYVRIVTSTLMEWSDACLGMAMPGVSCAPGVVPGFLVTLEAQGRQFQYHTNADASVVILATAP